MLDLLTSIINLVSSVFRLSGILRKPEPLSLDINHAVPLVAERQPLRLDRRQRRHEHESWMAVAAGATDSSIAFFFLRAAVLSTDGRIRRAGVVNSSNRRRYPVDQVSIQIGGESISSDTAAKAIRFVSALELLESHGFIRCEQRGRDYAFYKITPDGVEADSKTKSIRR